MTGGDSSRRAGVNPLLPMGVGGGFVPTGPVFVSYRATDGSPLARDVARALRVSGVPVWHDETDMPPGDTRRSIKDALAAGLSGGVLVVTPDIANSEVVKTLELPTLLELAKHPSFPMVIAHREFRKGRRAARAKLDYDAPDRLLGLNPPDLKVLKQYPLGTMTQAFDLARPIALQRMALHRATGCKRVTLDLQTRLAPRAGATDAPLVVRTTAPEPGRRVPPAHVWEDLSAFLAFLPTLLAEARAEEILIRGGAHLSVAYGFGAALPRTSPWRLLAEDAQQRATWEANVRSEEPIPLSEVERKYGPPDRPLAVFVDLVPGAAPNRAFDAEVARLREGLSGSLVLVNAGGPIPAASLVATMEEVGGRIRDAAAARRTIDVHLYLRTPWAGALLLGRELNTFRVCLYELEQTADDLPHYVPSVVAMSGLGGSPVTPHAHLNQPAGEPG